MENNLDRQELDTVKTKKNRPYNKRAVATLGAVLIIGLSILAIASSSSNSTGKPRSKEAPKYEPAQASNQVIDLDKKTSQKADNILDKYNNDEEIITPGNNNPPAINSTPEMPDIKNADNRNLQTDLQEERDRESQIKQAKQQWIELQRTTYLSQTQIPGQWVKNNKIQGKDVDGDLMGAVDNGNNSVMAKQKNPYLEVYERYLNESKPAGDSSSAQRETQTDKERFFNSTDSGRGTLKSTLKKQTSPYFIPSGTLIPCALISGVNSDLPGNIVAQVTENVCDLRRPDRILIPYGTKVFGKYDSRMAFAQRRVQLAWQKLIFPDGSTLDLQSMPGVTKQGYSGLSDKYYPRYGRLFTAAVMTAALSSVGLLFDNNNNNGQTIVTTSSGAVVIPDNTNNARDEFAKSVAESIGGAGTKLFDKFLNAPPTVLIRPAKRFNIMVNADIPFWSAYGKL